MNKYYMNPKNFPEIFFQYIWVKLKEGVDIPEKEGGLKLINKY